VSCINGAMSLRNTGTYSGSNNGNYAVSSSGCSITLNGNIWRIVQTGIDITPSTVVSFDFSTQGDAEIQGIGFDTDTGASANRIFKLAGNQNWGIGGFSYSGNGNVRRNLESVVPFTSNNSGRFSASQCTMSMQGNIWRATNETFNITPTSVLTFDFAANGTGEIHGIGFATIPAVICV